MPDQTAHQVIDINIVNAEIFGQFAADTRHPQNLVVLVLQSRYEAGIDKRTFPCAGLSVKKNQFIGSNQRRQIPRFTIASKKEFLILKFKGPWPNIGILDR